MIAAVLVSLQVTPALCQTCAACCSALVDGELVACRHLFAGGGTFRCEIYSDRPVVCRDYTCVRDGQISAVVAERVLAASAAVALQSSGGA